VAALFDMGVLIGWDAFEGSNWSLLYQSTVSKKQIEELKCCRAEKADWYRDSREDECKTQPHLTLSNQP
jgi:hypothetical protein